MLLIIKCINSIFFGEVYMKFKKYIIDCFAD